MFNGRELQDELGFGIYDYKRRFYDPALGKFISVDPLASSFPWWTPYQFTGNMPTKFVDLDGMEPAYYNPQTQEIIPASDHIRHTPPPNAVYFTNQEGPKSNVSLNVSVGFQAGVKVKNKGAEINFGSKEVMTLSTDKGVQPGDFNKTKKSWDVEMGVISMGASEETTTNSETQLVNLQGTDINIPMEVNTETQTNTAKVSLAGFGYEKQKTTETQKISGGTTISQTTKSSESSGYDAGALMPVSTGDNYSISLGIKIEVQIR